jgi:hypothetical protein
MGTQRDHPAYQAKMSDETGTQVSDSTKQTKNLGQKLLRPLLSLWRIPGRAWDALVTEKTRRPWGPAVFVLLMLALLYVGLVPAILLSNYRFPDASQAHVAVTPSDEADASVAERVPGTTYVDALLHIGAEGMRPWLVNDRFSPTILLDNPQNHQLGQLEGLRYGVRVLRDNLSRQRSTDALDSDIEEAHASLNISAKSWMLPRAETEHARALSALRRYREKLVRGEARFHPRADNLVELLRNFNSLTGGANNRLINCSKESNGRTSEETLGDPFLRGETPINTRVPWSMVDDHFYYAQGVAFAYREVMAAVTVEFEDILRQRNADELAQTIVSDFLDLAQFEPVYVARGDLGSMWANHPSQLLSLLSQVRERSRSLVTMIDVNVH